jgi:hypothetical protein
MKLKYIANQQFWYLTTRYNEGDVLPDTIPKSVLEGMLQNGRIHADHVDNSEQESNGELSTQEVEVEVEAQEVEIQETNDVQEQQEADTR